jgi:hypothetical protein
MVLGLFPNLLFSNAFLLCLKRGACVLGLVSFMLLPSFICSRRWWRASKVGRVIVATCHTWSFKNKIYKRRSMLIHHSVCTKISCISAKLTMHDTTSRLRLCTTSRRATTTRRHSSSAAASIPNIVQHRLLAALDLDATTYTLVLRQFRIVQ